MASLVSDSFLILRVVSDMNWTYLGGEGVVVVLPRELGLDVAAGVEGLAGLDHEEVLGVNFAVLGKVEVLLSHEHTLCITGLQSAIMISSRNIHSTIDVRRRGKVVHIPRKRYSWIFLRSSLGISLGWY